MRLKWLSAPRAISFKYIAFLLMTISEQLLHAKRMYQVWEIKRNIVHGSYFKVDCRIADHCRVVRYDVKSSNFIQFSSKAFTILEIKDQYSSLQSVKQHNCHKVSSYICPYLSKRLPNSHLLQYPGLSCIFGTFQMQMRYRPRFVYRITNTHAHTHTL